MFKERQIYELTIPVYLDEFGKVVDFGLTKPYPGFGTTQKKLKIKKLVHLLKLNFSFLLVIKEALF